MVVVYRLIEGGQLETSAPHARGLDRKCAVPTNDDDVDNVEECSVIVVCVIFSSFP